MDLEINSELEFVDWLRDKPLEWARMIALRAALRVFPLAAGQPGYRTDRGGQETTLSWFRCAVALCASQYDLYPELIKATIYGAKRAHLRDETSGYHSQASRAMNSALECYSLSKERLVLEWSFSSVQHANSAYLSYLDSPRQDQVKALIQQHWRIICDDLEGADNRTKPRENGLPLWDVRPEWFRQTWITASSWLSRPNEGFEIWREWYIGHLEGRSHAFKDFNDAADEEFYRFIVEQDNDWWDRTPAKVNADIKAKVEELRRAPPPTEEPQIEDVLGDTSSPIVTWVGGQISLVTREAFASVNPSDPERLKRRLLETAKFLENCANENAPPNLSGSFYAYHSHLEVNWKGPDPETLDIYASVVGSLRKHKEYDDWADGIGTATDKFLGDHAKLISGISGVPEQREERAQIVPRDDVDFAEAIGRFQVVARTIIAELDESGLARAEVIDHLNAQVQLAADMRFGPEPEVTLDEFFDLPEGWTTQVRIVGNIGGTYVSMRQNAFDTLAVTGVGATVAQSEAYKTLVTVTQPKVEQAIQIFTSLFKVAP